MSAGQHVVLAAGGTGGHMVPADALAAVLLRRGHQVSLLSDARGLRFPGLFEGVTRQEIAAASPGGINPLAWLRALRTILRGRAEAKAHLKSGAAAALVGFGGYPALPSLLAAASARVPSILHEQNAVLGRVNRLLSGRVSAIALSYAETARLDAAARARAVLTGNPVRPAVLAAREQPFAIPRPSEPFRLLVVGGSQGARILSQVVPEAIARLPDPQRRRLHVVQQCRDEDLAAVKRAFADAGVVAECAAYMTDMPERMRAAHLVIARSGASTMAELGVIGRPAVLVPFAAATDDHQAANAGPFVAAGAGVMLREAAFTPAALSARIAGFMASPEALAAAAAAARGVGMPDAADRLADLVEARMEHAA
jgi:UDP-N-acetylglucosamine--N-acetylmuramyl-(pentapeptide) pyrophosphoryl-undecaprenol N-acetylglucosamine transferase